MLETLPQRYSARLFLLNPREELLLFEYHDEHKPPFWATSGGELLPGESFLDAAQRELREETGLVDPIGPLVGEREAVYAVAKSTPARWRERYFLVHTESAGPPVNSEWTAEERSTIQNWKWWSLEEMQRSEATFLPRRLPELFERALARGARAKAERPVGR